MGEVGLVPTPDGSWPESGGDMSGTPETGDEARRFRTSIVHILRHLIPMTPRTGHGCFPLLFVLAFGHEGFCKAFCRSLLHRLRDCM